jgi:exonuclease SbcD
MKIMHLSDLHLGKTIHEFSMLEDQEYILKVILGIADEEKPEAVLICGDVYDRTVPPIEALRIFEDFLDGFVRRDIKVFIISGNHDSANRLSFGSRLMNKSGIFISPVYDGEVKPCILEDEHGEVAFYLLPFLKPAQIKHVFPDSPVSTWSDGIKTAINNMEIREDRRNILLCHQFVTGATTCESEELSVGGADNVDGEVFAPFDYVALGHLHGPQYVGRETLRYCGTPLKYSFSEVNHKKSVTIVLLKEKGNIRINEIPLVPKRDMCHIRGKYMEITSSDFYKNLNTDDYYRITLTDEEGEPYAMAKLRVIYPNLMHLNYDNKRTRALSSVSGISDASEYTPMELFDILYKEQNGQSVSDVQRDFLNNLIEEIWEGEK